MQTQIKQAIDIFVNDVVRAVGRAFNDALGQSRRSKPRGLAALSPRARSEAMKRAWVTRRRNASLSSRA